MMALEEIRIRCLLSCSNLHLLLAICRVRIERIYHQSYGIWRIIMTMSTRLIKPFNTVLVDWLSNGTGLLCMSLYMHSNIYLLCCPGQALMMS